MQRDGHYGLALIASTLVFVVPGWFDALYSAAGVLAALVCCQVPDIDHRTNLLKQRGATHTGLFALLFASVVGVVFWYAGTHVGGTPRHAAAAGGLGAFVGIVSHLVGDALTIHGIRPFWPASRRKIGLMLVTARNGYANRVLFFGGVVCLVVAALL